MARAGYQLADWVVLKIDDFINVLGDTGAEDTLLNYCISKNINWIQLYDLYSVFGNTTKEAQLSVFIAKVRASYPTILKVGAIMGAGFSGFDSALKYNSTVPVESQFNDFNKENEFWNVGGEPFADWIASLHTLQADPRLKDTDTVSAYLANPGAGAWGPVESDQIAGVADYLELTNYVTDYDTGQLNNCWQFLYESCKNLEVDQKFNLLVSSESGFDGPQFAATGNIPAIYAAFYSSFWSQNYPGRNRLVMNGVNFFAYTDLVAYLP